MRFTALIHSQDRHSFRQRGQSTKSMEAPSPTHDGPTPSGQASQFFGGLMKTELALYQALISINVSEQKANAVIEALETDMLTLLATKADITAIRAEIAQLEVRLTIRMGVMLSATTGVLIAAMKLLH